jgi:hypothetical protein
MTNWDWRIKLKKKNVKTLQKGQEKKIEIKRVRTKSKGKTNWGAALKIWKARQKNRGGERRKIKGLTVLNRRSVKDTRWPNTEGPMRGLERRPGSHYLASKRRCMLCSKTMTILHGLTHAMHSSIFFLKYLLNIKVQTCP